MPAPKTPTQATNNNAKQTPPVWSGPKDAREHKDAGKYPNYQEFKTRSGHVMIYDDSNGAESITLQHRTGSMVQFMPDGAVQIVTHNGQYNLIFGENRVLVTGAQDITVQGTGSLKVEGDYNLNVKGNMNASVDGDFNLTAKNFNQTIAEDIDVIATNQTTKLSGNMLQTAQGNMMIGSDGDATFASMSGTISIGASKDVGIRSAGAGVHLQSSDDTNIKSESKLNIQSAGKMSLKSAGTVAAEGSYIHMNTAGEANDAQEAAEMVVASPAPSTTKVAGSSQAPTAFYNKT